MSAAKYLREEWPSVHAHNGRTAFAVWPRTLNEGLTPQENAVYTGRFNFFITTGTCSLSMDPTPAEARALAAMLLTLADHTEGGAS